MPLADQLSTAAQFATVSDKPDAQEQILATAPFYEGLISNRTKDLPDMTRYLIIIAAAAVAAGSLVTVDARTPPEPQVVTKTAEGKPILLGRMVVTATALPEAK